MVALVNGSANHTVTDKSLFLQELFPRSYAETAEWLRRERTAYHDTLARCEDELSAALKADPQLMCLAVTCHVSHFSSSDSRSEWLTVDHSTVGY